MENTKKRKYVSIIEISKKMRKDVLNNPEFGNCVLIVSNKAISDTDVLNTFADRVKQQRERSNCSQKTVAEDMNVSQAAISRYENLHKKKISNQKRAVDTRRGYVEAFSMFYGVSPLYLLGFTNKENDTRYDKDLIINDKDYIIDPFSYLIVMELWSNPESVMIFEQVCDITSRNKRSNIKKLFKSIPAVKYTIDTERSNLSNDFYNKLYEFIDENHEYYGEIDRLVTKFDGLRKTDSDLYYLLANLCLNMNEFLKDSISNILIAGNYLD